MDEAKSFMLGLMQTARERFGNPFIGAFAISWLLWNFRLVLVIVGNGGGWAEKIQYIDTRLMPHWWHWALHAYLVPTLIALAWIYVFPPILRSIAAHHEKNQTRARDVLFAATEARTLSAEEALHLRTVMVKQRAEWQTEKAETVQSLESFERRTAAQAKTLEETQKELARAQQELEILKRPPPPTPFDFTNKATEDKARTLGLNVRWPDIEVGARVMFDSRHVLWPWVPRTEHLKDIPHKQLVKWPLHEDAIEAMLRLQQHFPTSTSATARDWMMHLSRLGIHSPLAQVRVLHSHGVFEGTDEQLILTQEGLSTLLWIKTVGFALAHP